MGSLTHTVSGAIANVRSPAVSPVRSLKSYFTPFLLGSGDPSPENVRPISDNSFTNIYKTGKNTCKMMGWSASSIESKYSTRLTTNTYGTTINTTDFVPPNGAVVITQSQAPESSKSHYKNGYVCVIADNMVYGRSYRVSFKISDIVSDPLNASDFQSVRLIAPSGGQYSWSKKLDDGTLIFNTFNYTRNSSRPNCASIDIRICGMSCTISNFMAEEISTEHSPYEEYNGDLISIKLCGKNMFNSSRLLETSGITYSNGYYTGTRSVFYNAYRDYFSFVGGFKPNTQYTLSFTGYQDSDTSFIGIGFTYTDGTSNVATISGTTEQTVTKTSQAGKTVDRVFFTYGSSSYIVIYLKNIQIEEGTTATTYEPYTPLAYGGYVDVVTGKVYATHQKLVADGTISWGNPTTIGSVNRFTMGVASFGGNPPVNGGVYSGDNLLLNYFKVGFDSSNVWNAWISSVYNICVYVPTTIATKEDWTNYLSEHPLEFVYRLETPIEIATISTSEISTLKGVTNFWCTTGNTSVEFDVAESSEMMRVKRRFAANTPHICDATGDVAKFYTDTPAKLKNCVIKFDPKQEGSGDPSPSNVRPISGYTGLNVHHGKKMVTWNQWMKPLNSDNYAPYNTSYTSLTFNNDVGTSTWLAEKYGYSASIRNTTGTVQDENQIWYVSYMVNPSKAGLTWGVEFLGGRQIICIENTASNTWSQCSAVNSYYRGASNYTYIANMYSSNGAEIGMSCQFKSPILVNLTQMFGAGNEPTKAEFEAQCALNGIDLTQYQPYNIGEPIPWVSDANEIYPISWASEGNIYGGTLDVKNGILKKTRSFTVLDGSETKYTISGGGKYRFGTQRGYAHLSGNENMPNIYDSYSVNPTLISNRFKSVSANNIYGGEIGVGIGSDGSTLWFSIGEADMTEEKAREFFTNNPTQVSYELAIPVEYSLTPTQIKAFLNSNTIWSDGQSTVDFYTRKERLVIDWNQLVKDGDFSDAGLWIPSSSSYGTISIANNQATWTCTDEPKYYYNTGVNWSRDFVQIPQDHYVYATATVRCSMSVNARIYGMIGGENSYSIQQDIVANEWRTIFGSIRLRENNKIITKFKCCFSTGVSNPMGVAAGTTYEVKNLMAFDITKMFGAGNEPTLEEFQRLCNLNGINLDTYQPFTESEIRYWKT